MKIDSLCVFCGSSPGRGDTYLQAADEVGRKLAQEGIRLVYGGGSVGLMGQVADSCLEAGGEVIGVITRSLLDLEVGHTGCTELEVVETMLERKMRMAELSNAFVSLPGGIGTLDEMFEMITWTQLDIHQKPSGLLNVDGYYDDLHRFLNRVVDQRFLLDQHRQMILTADRFDSLLEDLRSWQPTPVEKWVDRHTNARP